MTGTVRALLASFVFTLTVHGGIAATPPERIGYQGVLRDAAGAPLDGTYDMVFRFTDAPTGGTLLLTDYHTGPGAIVVDGGLFTALLGGGTLSPGTESSLQEIFAAYSPVFVEVQVGPETLAPRVEIVSTAYALNAGRFGGQLPGDYLDTGPTAQVKQGSLISDTSLVAQSDETTGDVRAVHGTTVSTAGIGVLGSALADSGATEGVRGQSTSPDGRGVVGGAFATSGANIGVYGESQSLDGTGVHGRVTAASGGTVGVGGESFSSLGIGVAGVASATEGDAWGVYGETASPTGYGVVSIGDSITAGDVYATGTKYFLTEHPHRADSGIRFACLEGGEVGVFQRGVGRLEGGQARIELPDPFPLVATGSITVQVTAQEDSGGLYVPQDSVSPGGFTVRESGGARSDAAFTYLVMAERAGFEGAGPVRSISISEKIVTSSLLTPGQKAALRGSLSPGAIGRLGAAGRDALYSALHEGDFAVSCRLLDGCGTGTGVQVDRDRDEAAQERRDLPAAAAGPAPEASTDAPQRGADRAISIDRSGESPAQPLTPPEAVMPPSFLAALHVVSEAVEAGDVVVVDRLSGGALRPGNQAYDPGVVGVVAFVGSRVVAGETAPVAVAGTVSCRVDADYGWIEAGDLLVVSPTPGHAMRADAAAPGTILGKALEPLDVGRGKIRILLTPR